MSSLRERLLRLELPEADEDAAWNVVRRAYAEREPVRRRHHLVRPALVLAVVLAAAAAAFATPPGRAVLGSIANQLVGEKHAAPALFSLPSPGRLIVESSAGPWIVQADGSKRLLSRYRALTWSPHGRFVAGTTTHELVALEPGGKVHWSLARPGAVRLARWSPGTNDTRIAYFSGSQLRVVGGDGRGDRLLAANAAPVAPAWVPVDEPHLLAFADRRGGIHLVDVDRPAALRAASAGEPPTELAWTADGRFLLALGRTQLRVFGPDRREIGRLRLPDAAHTLAVSPSGHRVALTSSDRHGRGEVLLYSPSSPSRPPQRLFADPGEFGSLAWSPDGRWLLVGWPTANQWLFLRTARAPRIKAVANITQQFESRSFPAVEGWCCGTR
jgi:WD40 repeat protein